MSNQIRASTDFQVQDTTQTHRSGKTSKTQLKHSAIFSIRDMNTQQKSNMQDITQNTLL